MENDNQLSNYVHGLISARCKTKVKNVFAVYYITELVIKKYITNLRERQNVICCSLM